MPRDEVPLAGTVEPLMVRVPNNWVVLPLANDDVGKAPSAKI